MQVAAQAAMSFLQPLANAIYQATGSRFLAALGTGILPALQATPKPKVNVTGSPVDFRANPDAPLLFPIGEGALTGTQVHANTSGATNNYLSFITVLSALPAAAITGFSANGSPVAFTADGGEGASGFYLNRMWMKQTLGSPSGTWLRFTSTNSKDTPANHGGNLPEWTASHRLTNCAATLWTMRADTVKYPTGVPKPLWTGKWIKAWDPRLDSTYPGGSGPHRRDDWRTWEWTANPHLHALAWARGHRVWKAEGSLGELMGGIGAPDTQIDIASFVVAANVADANGWKAFGVPTTADDKWNVLAAMLQAGGAQPLSRGAKIGCMVNAPRASIYTLTKEDLAGEVQIDASTSRRDRINTVIPKYRSSKHGWEMIAGLAVTAALYVAEDGAEARAREIEFPYVAGGDAAAVQASQLAAYELTNTREALSGTLPCKPHMLGLRAGDAFIGDEPETGLNGQKCIVTKRDFDLQSGIVTISFRSESDGKHDFALGRTDEPPATPALTGVDPSIVLAPGAGSWQAAVDAVTGAGGSQIPRITVRPGTGDPDNTAAAETIVGTRRVDALNAPLEAWSWRSYPYTNVLIELLGLAPNTRYEVAVRYKVRGVDNPDIYRSLGFFVTPALIAGDTRNLGGRPVEDVLDDIATSGGQVVSVARRRIAEIQLDQAANAFRLSADLQQRRHVAELLTEIDGERITSFAKRRTLELEEAGSALAADTLVLFTRTDAAEATAIEDRNVFTAANLARAQETSALGVRVGAAEGAIIENKEIAASATLIVASSVDAMAGRLTDAEGLITYNRSLSVSEHSVVLGLHDAMVARVDGVEGAFIAHRDVSVDRDSVHTLNFDLQGGRVGSNSGWRFNETTVEVGLRGSMGAILDALVLEDGKNVVAIGTEKQLRLDGDGALSTRIDNLTVTYDGRYATITHVNTVEIALDGRIKAKIGAVIDVNGVTTGWEADGVTRAIRFHGAYFSVSDGGNGLSYEPATGRLKVVRDGQKTVLGAGGGITLWAGPTSISDGSETIDNGLVGIGPGDAWFGGRTLAGFFTSDAPAEIGVPGGGGWTTVVSLDVTTRYGGFGLFARLASAGIGRPRPGDEAPSGDNPAGSPGFYYVQGRIISTNLSGGDVVELITPVRVAAAQTPYNGSGSSAVTYVVMHQRRENARNGPRRVILQVRPEDAYSDQIRVSEARLEAYYLN